MMYGTKNWPLAFFYELIIINSFNTWVFNGFYGLASLITHYA